MSRKVVTVDEILAGKGPEIEALAHEVRDAILGAAPQLEERALPGWQAVSFRSPERGFVCALFPYADRVRIAFEHGVDLIDPDGRLEKGSTSSKRVRYLSFRPGQAVDADLVDFFVNQYS